MRGRVFQRTRGRGRPWSYVVDLPAGPDGRRRQRLKGGFRTKEEAQTALSLVVADSHRGVVVDATRVTLGEFLEDWLASVSRSLKPTTWEGYAHASRAWIIPRIGGYRLAVVTPEIPSSSRRCSVTPGWRSPSTCTRTSPPRCTTTPPTGLVGSFSPARARRAQGGSASDQTLTLACSAARAVMSSTSAVATIPPPRRTAVATTTASTAEPRPARV